MGQDQRGQRPERQRLAAVALDVAGPEREAGQVDQRGAGGVEDVDDRQRQQHPGQREAAGVAGNMVGLGDERDGRADGERPEQAEAFAPGRGFLAGVENPQRQQLRGDQRREGQRGARGAGEIGPIVGEEENDAEADERAAEDAEDRQRPVAAFARGRFVVPAQALGGGAVDHPVFQQRRQFPQHPADLFLRHR